MDETRQGRGGGIRCGYDEIGRFTRWNLTSVGPGLYRFEAWCEGMADGLLSLPGLTLWVPVGHLHYEWTQNGPVPHDGDRVDCVVDAPRLTPARLEESDAALSVGETE